MKKILCALLACLMLTAPVLTACTDASSDDKNSDNSGSSSSTTTSGETDPSTPDVPDTPEPPLVEEGKYTSLKIGGVDISEYQIVYAPDSFADIKNQQQYKVSFAVGVTHYEREIALELAADIKTMTGVEVPVVPAISAETEHEILIGRTGRTDAENNRLNKEIASNICMINMLEPGKLWFIGGSPAAMYDTLNKLYTELDRQGTTDVVIPDNYYVKADADVITVSCIGDSITDGFNGGFGGVGTDNRYISWPAVAQRILWKEYAFSNFGVSGMTMRTDHKDAYINCSKYPQAIAAAPTADITIIMLGTNDSDRFKNWTEADTQKYVADYTAFVDELQELNPETQFILMNCPEYFNGTGKDGEFGSDRMIGIQKDIFDMFKAEGRKVSFFDMHAFTASDEMGKEMFYDGLHPSNPGYVKMASRICTMLESFMNNIEDPLLTK